MYNPYWTSVGNKFKHVQIMTKYRYQIMQKNKIETFCKVAIEEACKKHRTEIIILNVQSDHVNMTIDVQEQPMLVVNN